MTVTPVLADQLEDAGRAASGCATSWSSGGSAPPKPTSRKCRPSAAPACEAELARYRRALELLDAAGGDPLAPFQRAARGGAGRAGRLLRDPRGAAAAGDAGRACGCSSTPASARTAAASAGTAASGCPSAPTRRASSGGWPRPGCGWFCVDQSAHEEPLEALAPVRTEAGPGGAADRLGGDRLALVARRLPLRPRPRPVRRQIAARDPALEGRRRRLRPGRRRGRGAPPGGRVPRRHRGPPARLRRRRTAAAACSSSRSTPSCSATGGRRARSGCGRCWRAPRRPGCGLLTVPQALAEHEPVERQLARLDLGRGQGLRAPGTRRRSPTSPGARGGWSCGCCGRSRRACDGDAALRAARELLAAQASDWAFLDKRGQAGDYAYQRATDHARAMLEAIDSRLCHRPAYALPRPGPEPRSAAGAVAPPR